MDPIPLTLTLIFFFFFFFTISAINPCKPDSCNSILGPQVEFPFRLKRQPARCGYPGFDLYCNTQNQTILNLPFSGKFIVDHINYKSKSLFINFTFSSRRPPQFPATYTTNYTFLNCSSDYKHYHSTPNMSLFCLSRRNYTVLAMSPRSSAVPPTCRRIESVLVPLQWTLSKFQWSAMDLQDDLQQVWSQSNEGGLCGYKGDSGPEVGCFGPRPSKGNPKSAKYCIITGAGIAGLVCIIALAFYACGKVSGFNLRPITVLDQRPTTRSTNGLDRPTIESYPTTVLGQSRRLPNPSDATCPICLSNYQPNETLRSIPECNHYFHADCIDEWLKLNGTCPLCRNSRESSIATPCFSSSTSSPSTILDRR